MRSDSIRRPAHLLVLEIYIPDLRHFRGIFPVASLERREPALISYSETTVHLLLGFKVHPHSIYGVEAHNGREHHILYI